MPSTAKDSFLESTTAAGPAKTEPQASQPSDAVGAEISVTVHASRYSAAAKGAGKLPPVHEETRTVIIFPQGAVVRLSATVAPGELVVLTNNRTGADVICRVTSVKTQPGIQNYVNLEFTQRAVGFWEEARQTERANGADKPALAAVSPAMTSPAPTPITTGYKAPSSPVQQPHLAARTSAPAGEAKPISAQPLKVSSLADAPVEKSRQAAEDVPAAPPHISEIAPAPAFPNKQPLVLPSRTPRAESFEAPSSPGNQGSKNIVLIVTAAVVLLAVGAVGGALFLRWNRGVGMTQQLSTPATGPIAAIPAPLPVSPEPAAPTVNASGKPNSIEPANAISTPARNSESGPSAPPQPVPARLAVETPKVEVHSEASPQPVTRPTIKLGKIAAPSVKTAKVNSVEPPPVLPPGANALPGGLNESVLSSAARNYPAAPPQPVAAPIKGGQLQQPKLVSSVAAVYPASAKAARVQGDVTVDALVDATGKVTSTKVVNGSPLLQQAAVTSVQMWRYEPARLNGEPIPIHIMVNVNFRLQ